MDLLRLADLALAAAASLAGGPDPRSTLTIFAAASLTEAFLALGAELERTRPGLTVRFNFAGSQQLALQLRQGAIAHVFASADQRWMTDAQEHGLVDGEPHVFARNRLVVIVPTANPARIERLEDLARAGVKLVLAAEAVPVGVYSREAMRNLARAPGFPVDYARRVLANVVSEEENVKAVVAKVQLGEADAGIAYRSDLTSHIARRIRVFDVPEAYNVVANYPIAVLKGATNPEAARAFVALVLSPAGQQVLRAHGFSTAGPPVRTRPT